MTEETAQLFNVPWHATDLDHVEDSEDCYICECDTHKTANRLARLPEMYDALVYFVHRSCSSAKIDRCPNQGAGWIGCRDCSLMPYIELLRKVKDGVK